MQKEIISLRKIDLREENFIQAYLELGDPVAAARAAGYSKSYYEAVRTKVLTQPHIAFALAAAVHKRFAACAPMAQSVLEHLAQHAVSERVRADCAKDLLNRAGYVAPRMPDKATEAPLHELSTDALKALASRLEGELAGRAKPVISATAAPEDEQDIDI